MSDQRLRRLAWAIVAAFALLVPVGGFMDPLAVAFMLSLLVFCGVGALVVARQPRNAIGWLLLGVGVGVGLGLLSEIYVDNSYPPYPPAAALVAWFSTWALFVVIDLAGVFLPLLFPDGKLSSPGARWIAWAGVLGTAAEQLAPTLKAGPLDLGAHKSVANPLGISHSLNGALDAIAVAGTVLITLAVLAALASLVLRLRRARGEERVKIKWFVYVCAVTVGGFVLAGASTLAGHETVSQVGGTIGWFTGLLGLVFGMPAVAAISVLRHRLWDVDVVINRTIVYLGLTASLAALYLGSVLLLQLALDAITSGSSLAVAVSTLAVAALFRPVRGRIQGVVDRRFYRRKYDAARTLEGFSARLREEVDLDALGGELRSVVRETMQPAHVSLWLRGSGARR